MITIDELIRQLEAIKEINDLAGDTPVVIDDGCSLVEVAEVDLGASDEGVILWVGNVVEY